MFDRRYLAENIVESLKKLDPRQLWHNPVMFVVEIGTAFATIDFLATLDKQSSTDIIFAISVLIWLFFTLVFANFSEVVAERRGRAQAASLRSARTSLVARVINGDTITEVPAETLQVGDRCRVSAGEVIPCDGEVIEGIASVDESAITGESAPVIREAGGDRSSVTGGTKVLSDEIVVIVTQEPGKSFLEKMISLVEGANRQKTPNEVALNILLSGLSIILLLSVATLQPFAIFSHSPQGIVVLVALLVCLIPTTIGALLSAIGIAGIDRLVKQNVLATSGRAVEAAGDCNTLLLDKTGTITYGNRQAVAFYPSSSSTERELALAARLASLADQTPEGRSIVELSESLIDKDQSATNIDPSEWISIPFSANTRMSGVDIGGSSYRKGAGDAVASWVVQNGGSIDQGSLDRVSEIASNGGTPLLVAQDDRCLGVVYLKDVVKKDIAARFATMRALGIRTVMVTGDNPVTAAVIAKEAGVDDFIAQATPEDKLSYIRAEQRSGSLVAMTGDGTNDAPALAQADVGVAMNSGTQAAKEAGNMVDLDSNPTKLLEIVEIGKQLLITRGSLTTFSIANDIAKYFAIIPAMFQKVFPALKPLNIMHLTNAHTAILAAVIFNALIIVALIPLALRGVKFRATSSSSILRRNLSIYGIGGVVLPFIAIKAIDVVLTLIGVK
ncbi:MAG: potassium-transporting ATPase subunit KdpB [Actinomycetota bacterium]|nr:potassium-transporting ATPase subunit KdpB [Actinomycetota bacterium]